MTVQLVSHDPSVALETPHNVKSKSIVELIGLTARGANGASLDVTVGRPTSALASPTYRLLASITSSSPKAALCRRSSRARLPMPWRRSARREKW